LNESVAALIAEALEAILDAGVAEESLSALRHKYLGRKGRVTERLRGLAEADPAERPRLGAELNAARERIAAALDEAFARARDAERARAAAAERIDVTLPGRRPPIGALHPIGRMIDEISEIFLGLGFEVREGPEVETEYANFDALNTPPDHPARDGGDSFYVRPGLLLRTHTSPVQIRTMESEDPPIRIIAPGRVYRRDALDATHSAVFHQVEGLCVDRGVTMSDLKGTLAAFVRRFFGARHRVRFRPSYFPFVEPGAEVDMSCILCDGRGCRVCKGSGWIEILGAGMVHPRVLSVLAKRGHDPSEFTGFAFGMGIERPFMLRHGVDDIRHLFENDLRFLRRLA
jgi:phenylalanyl-tRNA synthetase alpha chain